MKKLILTLVMACGACKQPASQARIGEDAPAYAALSLAGDSISLASLNGKVVLLNVWATWCIPCRKELPELQALHLQYAAQGLQVVGVSVDDASADEAVRDFIQRFGLTYTILRDPGEVVSSAFLVPGVPATFMIDRNGKLAWRHLGPFTAKDPGLVRALEQTL